MSKIFRSFMQHGATSGEDGSGGDHGRAGREEGQGGHDASEHARAAAAKGGNTWADRSQRGESEYKIFFEKIDF